MTARAIDRTKIGFALFLILTGAALRVLRHYGWIDVPPNFAPVSGLAMFSSVYLPRRLALTVPLGLMLMSDLLIGFDMLPITISIYGCFAASWLLGQWLQRRLTVGRLALATLAGSTLFYLVTNAAVWAFTTMYMKTGSGLMAAYIAGLPFWRNTVAGDLAYSAILFGSYQLVVVYLTRRFQTRAALING